MLYSIAGMIHLLSHNKILGYKFLALAAIALLLAKHRPPLIAAAAGFVFLRGALFLLFRWDWQLLLAIAISGLVLLALVPFFKNYRSEYPSPSGYRIADAIVAVASLGLSLYVATLIRR
ncbi:MAG: hypothetical protein NVS9B14_10860 [Candidatus Acidiferrum sp.]